MKCTILFGAGAEQPLGMSNGMDFAKKVAGIEAKEMNEAIKQYYQEIVNNENDWYPQYSGTNWKIDDLIKAALRKQFLDEKLNTKTEYEDKVEKLSKRCKYKPALITALLNEYSSYIGLVDSLFYTLINPRVLGPKKFWRVVTAYCRAYLYLIGEMTDEEDEDKDKYKYYKILSDWNYTKEIMDKYAKKNMDKESYYSILRHYNNKVNVVTTNYTNLCEKIADIPYDKISYIHGKFGWFESAQELITYDAYSGGFPSGMVFPYIFIQSGLKPIVERRQIGEYSKMYNFFEESDIIIILGYRINVDDNHINSMIKSALLANKEVKYFNFDEKENAVKERLRIDNDKEVRLDILNIDKNNCYSEFERVLNNIVTVLQ